MPNRKHACCSDSPHSEPEEVDPLTRTVRNRSAASYYLADGLEATPLFRAAGIDRLLRLAAARGASALYLTSEARPCFASTATSVCSRRSRVSSADVEGAVLELAPETARNDRPRRRHRVDRRVAGRRPRALHDLPRPSRARRLLRMIAARATSAEQLGLAREIQALATEPKGLVLVTGPRASGKSTLMSAFVDLINRQRNDYVITLEGQIRLVHESRAGAHQPARDARRRRRVAGRGARRAAREPRRAGHRGPGVPHMVPLLLDRGGRRAAGLRVDDCALDDRRDRRSSSTRAAGAARRVQAAMAETCAASWRRCC